MKNIKRLYGINLNINDIKTSSKNVSQNDAFVCIKGVKEDRHNYIDDALKKGATFLIVSKGKYDTNYIKVKNVHKELLKFLNYFYNDASKIDLIGTTGTDGKTTTSEILRDMLGSNICGYIGTNGIKNKDKNINIDNTTPEVETIYKNLDNFYKNNLKYATLEVSSEGLLNKRVDSLKFKVAIFTNIKSDHLNVHKTFNNYLKCKKKLFKQVKDNGYSILNIDDSNYKKIRRVSKGKILTYGFNKRSTLRIKEYKLYEDKTEIEYIYNNKIFKVQSPLLGKFNIYNLSAAILTMLALGYKEKYILERIKKVKRPYGRCEVLDYNTPYKIILDYAHTENGIKEILSYVKNVCKGRIISISGSAGGRDKEKRPKMGKVLQDYSDFVIYTMDDPREENPRIIANQMINKNLNNYTYIENRKDAIYYALRIAKKDDYIVVLGKGRDNYMAIKNEKVFYSDLLVIDNFFNK